MSVEYSAIAAKLKAMYSKFLTRDDYEQLLERKSVNDICSSLKSITRLQMKFLNR